MSLQNVRRKTTALVPAAAPIIVEALRAGPLTTQELWAKCISDDVQNVGTSQQGGAGADKLGLHEVFKTKTDLKKRILPVLEANAIIQQHHLQYPQTRIVKPATRLRMITEKLVSKRTRSKASSSASSSTTTPASSSSPTASSSSTTADFVWSLNHNLMDRSAQHPELRDATLTSKLEDRLARISSGTESVHLITTETRAEKQVARDQYHASKILRLSEVQNVWSRPAGMLNPKRYGVEAEDWVTSEEERQHLNKRRGLKRVEKEGRMVKLVKLLRDAYEGKASPSA